MNEKPQTAGAGSAAEAGFWQDWADKVPGLLRDFAVRIPEAAQQAQPKNPYRAPGLVIGAVLGAATFTKAIKGNWKWLTGGAAAGAIGTGLYMGNKFDEVMAAIHHTLPEMANAFNTFADTLENDPQLRKKLAEYLAANITAEDIQQRGIEDAVAGKTVEFGRKTLHLDLDAVSSRIRQNMAAAGQMR